MVWIWWKGMFAVICFWSIYEQTCNLQWIWICRRDCRKIIRSLEFDNRNKKIVISTMMHTFETLCLFIKVDQCAPPHILSPISWVYDKFDFFTYRACLEPMQENFKGVGGGPNMRGFQKYFTGVISTLGSTSDNLYSKIRASCPKMKHPMEAGS